MARLDRWLVEVAKENSRPASRGRAPDAPTWRPHRERIAVAGRLGRVAWERKNPRNDQSLRWRRFIQGADSVGRGRLGRRIRGARAADLPGRPGGAGNRRIPHLLADATAGRPLERVSGAAGALRIATLPDGTRLEPLLRSTASPRAAAYRARLLGIGPTRGAVVLDWMAIRIARSAMPSGHRIEVGGVVFQEVRYTSYAAGSDSAEALVRLPRDPARFASHAAMNGFPSVAPSGDPAPGVRLIDARISVPRTSRSGRGRTSALLAKLGYMSDGEVTNFVATQYRLPSINLDEYEIDGEVLAPSLARSARSTGSSRFLARGSAAHRRDERPTDLNAIDDIKFLSADNVEPVVASETAIQGAVERYYDTGPSYEQDADFDLADDEIDFAVDGRGGQRSSSSSARAPTRPSCAW